MAVASLSVLDSTRGDWHREGPAGIGGHNLRRPEVGTRIDVGDRDYFTTWRTGDQMTGADHWTNNVARQIHNRKNSGASNTWNLAYEVVDFDAYNRSGQYSQWLRATGKEGFTSLQDIHTAEDWMSGAGERRERQALAELQAKYEQERLRREEAERVRESLQPKYLDIGGQQIAVGGVNDYIQGLHRQWDQTSTNQLNALTQRFQADQARTQQEWTTRFSDYELENARNLQDLQYRRQNELTDLRSSFADKSAAQDRLYNTRIADLTSQWGDQRSQFERSIGGLEGQITSYQDQERANQEARMQDAQRARVASAYAGSPGWNAPGGVHSGKALQPPRYRPLGGGTTGQFGRSGMRISSLNI